MVLAALGAGEAASGAVATGALAGVEGVVVSVAGASWPPAVAPPTGATAATVAGRSSDERRLAVISAGSATKVSAKAMIIRVRSCESTTLRAPPSCEVDSAETFRRCSKL